MFPPAILTWRQQMRQVRRELGFIAVEFVIPPLWVGSVDPAEILISVQHYRQRY